MVKGLQLPPGQQSAKQVGRKLFRKQILPVGHLEVKGRRLNFTPEVLREMKATFEERTMDQVPFVLANESNAHTDDPERFRGDVQALEVADDGLYATVQTTDRGAALLAENPKLPVSVRAFPPEVGRAGGRWVLGHVCGTLDPVATGMGRWATVDASEGVEILDLSAGEFFPSGGALSDSGVATEQGSSTAEAPNAEQRKLLERFRDFLSGDGGKDAADTGGAAASAADTTSGETDSGAGESDVQVSDAEVDRVLAALLADAADAEGGDGDEDGDNGDGEGDNAGGSGSEEGESGSEGAENREAVAATAGSDAAVELANSRISTLETTLSAERAERARERFDTFRRELVEDGVPPAMIDLARPVLEHPVAGPVELSNGVKHDVQDTVRKLLDAARGTVELSERGSAQGDDSEGDERRKQWAKDAEKEGRVL